MDKNLVSAIIPVYNRANMLKECVESVLAQTYRPIEIIIVDDGSTDNTPEVGAQLAKECPDEVIYVRTENSGPGLARETGRQLVKGEYVQYLDSDDLLLPGKFELQVAGLEASPDCSLSYGKTREYVIGEKPIDIASRRTGEKHEKLFPAVLGGRLWATETPLFRRTALEEIGPWSDLRVLEDWEYECRLGAVGVKLHYCDEFISDHRHHDGVREGLRWRNDIAVFKDMLNAHHKVLEYAENSGVKADTPEMKCYARNLFRLARDAGVRGLNKESRELLSLAENTDSGRKIEYRLYRLCAGLLGWKATADWSGRLARGFYFRRGI